MRLTLLRRLRHHFTHHPLWQRSGLYAAILAGLVYASQHWPFDFATLQALLAYPQLMEFEDGILQAAWTFLVILAFVGLCRPGLLERPAALLALYIANAEGPWVFMTMETPVQMAGRAILYAFVIAPFEAALSLAHDVQGMAAFYVGVYFALIWIAVRAIARLSAAWVGTRLTRVRPVTHA